MAHTKDTPKEEQKEKEKDHTDNREQEKSTKPAAIICGIPGHSARDCRKRQGDEKTKQMPNTKKTKEVKNNVVQIADETDMQFSQHVVSATLPPNKPMRTSPSTERDQDTEPMPTLTPENTPLLLVPPSEENERNERVTETESTLHSMVTPLPVGGDLPLPK
jgi:hypothetical protein